MTDGDLEEICTSRGFELVKELDESTGEPLVYSHQDYIDAASGCLQIEADLEEILQTHPEILEDVKRESNRMMNERDRLIKQLEVQNGTQTATEPHQTGDGQSINATVAGESKVTGQSTKTLTYDVKELTLEVVAQIKSDVTKVVNFIVPEKQRDMIGQRIRQHILPALKAFVYVAKDMGMTTYDMLRRYLNAFLNKKGREGLGGDAQEGIKTTN
ncbi:hypothetical protein ACHAWF_017343 [Thalassiosira exigua]